MLQRKPSQVPAWHLSNQRAMLTALDELAERGWRGALMRSEPPGKAEKLRSAMLWTLELNHSAGGNVTARLGDWLVLDGGLKAMSDEECTEQYDPVEG